MPTPQEIEAYLNQMGQGVTQAGQNAINQNVDIPAQAKLAALQKTSAGAGPSGGMGGMPGATPQPSPQASAAAAALSTGSGNPGMASGNGLNFDEMAAHQAAMKAMYPPAQPEEDFSGYADVPKPNQMRQFPTIQAKMNKGQPVNSQDIRQALKGPTEVTPELEKQLGYGDQDEDDDENKQRAENNNNRSGSSEGSYSGS